MRYKLYNGTEFVAQGSMSYIEEVIEDMQKSGRRYDFIIKPKNFLKIRK